jgi:hypothetical protein
VITNYYGEEKEGKGKEKEAPVSFSETPSLTEGFSFINRG